MEDAEHDARDQHERALENEEDGLVPRQLAVEALAQLRDSVRGSDEDAERRERQPYPAPSATKSRYHRGPNLPPMNALNLGDDWSEANCGFHVLAFL